MTVCATFKVSNVKSFYDCGDLEKKVRSNLLHAILGLVIMNLGKNIKSLCLIVLT